MGPRSFNRGRDDGPLEYHLTLVQGTESDGEFFQRVAAAGAHIAALGPFEQTTSGG